MIVLTDVVLSAAVAVMWLSMQAVGLPEVPAWTVVVARAAFPNGSLPIRVRNRLWEVFVDEPVTEALGVRGAPSQSPGVLTLVTVLQFADDLTDRQAAAMAVRAIDWKYALGVELTDTGFDALDDRVGVGVRRCLAGVAVQGTGRPATDPKHNTCTHCGMRERPAPNEPHPP
ncbi:transposase [Streptomyces sp. NBC_00631]|uniref:transposase n=1 Tax=Streptomyces sp. NBC_00631 TaxID=2975793 RepID=UPI00386BF3E0